MPRVAFTGTRNGMTPVQMNQFSRFVAQLYQAEDENEWHDGDCVGADSEAHQVVAGLAIAHVRKGLPRIKMVGHPGDTPQYYASNVFDESWEIKGNIDRNHDMVDVAEVLVACPGEMTNVQRSGTWSTIRYARKRKEAGANLVLIIIYPNGNWEKI